MDNSLGFDKNTSQDNNNRSSYIKIDCSNHNGNYSYVNRSITKLFLHLKKLDLCVTNQNYLKIYFLNPSFSDLMQVYLGAF